MKYRVVPLGVTLQPPELVIAPELVAVVALVALVAVAALPPIDNPAAVPVMFVPTNAVGVPRAGVTNVGLVANTTPPEPVEADVDPVPPEEVGSAAPRVRDDM